MKQPKLEMLSDLSKITQAFVAKIVMEYSLFIHLPKRDQSST